MKYKLLSLFQPMTFIFTILVMSALYGDLYFSFSQQGWMTITVLLMTQFSVGTWVRQTIIRTITIMIALLLIVFCQQIDFSDSGLVLFSCIVIIALFSILLLDIRHFNEWMVFSLVLLLSIGFFMGNLVNVSFFITFVANFFMVF